MLNSLDLAAISHHGMGNALPTEFRTSDCRLFARAYGRGKRRAFWHRVRGMDNCLKDFSEIKGSSRRLPAAGMGIASVPLVKITGSEGRTNDFDGDFNPLNRHNRQRWIGIAAARRQGKMLPPVDLIQVGDEYYVRDGHHRVSVARALGQETIEARILWVISLQRFS